MTALPRPSCLVINSSFVIRASTFFNHSRPFAPGAP
jgi:hypothetical protein